MERMIDGGKKAGKHREGRRGMERMIDRRKLVNTEKKGEAWKE